mmetsp:Transcript_71174/g.119146  ORF Transcript_71174/g.119146 Transcript_71174/m.119146 type:complete len:94 (+) Transcript_71174:438-719(+)
MQKEKAQCDGPCLRTKPHWEGGVDAHSFKTTVAFPSAGPTFEVRSASSSSLSNLHPHSRTTMLLLGRARMGAVPSCTPVGAPVVYAPQSAGTT